MDTNTDSAPTLDAEGASLRALAVAEDNGTPVEIEQTEAEHGGPAEQDGASDQGENGGSDAATSPQTDKPGTALPSDKGPKAPVKEEQPPKEESAYARLKKDQARLARNRQEHQAEREKFLREREEFLREQAANREARPEQPARTGPLADFDDQALADYADQAESAGKYELAKIARRELAQRRERPQRADAPPAAAAQRQQQQQQQLLTQWKANLSTLQAENPELSDPASDLYKETAGILKARPMLHTYSDGIRDAVQLAKLQKEASAVPSLRTKVTELEKEVQRLRAATTPAGGAPEQRGGAAKPFDQMSDAEQRAHLRRQAAEVDGA